MNTITAIKRVEQALAIGDTDSAFALLDQWLSEDRPLRPIERDAITCHRDPKEVLDCQRDKQPDLWVHTRQCTVNYWWALLAIDDNAAAARMAQ